MRILSVAALLLLIINTGFAQAEDKEEEKKTSIAYHELNPSIVVNIQGKGKYMRCDVQLMTRDDTNLPDLQTHSPALRNELLLLFGDQKGEILKSPKGKEKLRTEALKSLQQLMETITGKPLIDDLYFTAFFVQ